MKNATTTLRVLFLTLLTFLCYQITFCIAAPINFNDHTISSYGSGQDVLPTVSIENSGSTLKVVGNAWKKIDYSYTVTPDTVLEFDFQSNHQGEIQGIGVDNDNITDITQTFKLYGTQNWGNLDYNTYAGHEPGLLHYKIKLGDYRLGAMQYLTFANDHDVVAPTAESIFSNVTIYEDTNNQTQPPVAVDDSANTQKNTSTTIHVLSNDHDSDGSLDTSSVAISAQGTKGTATANTDGTVTYTPNTNEVGTDTFSYTVNDDQGNISNLATVTISITSSDVINFNHYTFSSYGSGQDVTSTINIENQGNSVRILGNTWKKINYPYTVTENTVLEFDYQSSHQGEIQGIGVDNDNVTDRSQTFKLYGTQSWGVLDFDTYAGNEPGVVHYKINLGQYSTGVVQYLCFANDHDIANPTGESVFSNVIIYEDTGSNQAPTANDDSISTDQDQAVTANVLSNDTDSDGTLNVSTVNITTQGTKGTATAQTDGTVIYTPNAGETGTDTFQYTVNDNEGATSNIATVNVTINSSVNQAPQANDDAVSIAQNQSVTVHVLNNDSDSDGSLDVTSIHITSQGAKGVANANADGTVTYVPNAGESGTDSFNYTVNDNAGATSNTATVSISINVVNGINFNNYTLSSYGSGQDVSSVVTIENNGASLKVIGNAWKKIDYPYTVTENTVLEFDYQSSQQGEIQGIGVDNDNITDRSQTFKLYGTQSWGVLDYDTYAGNEPSIVHYKINLGQHSTGAVQYLCFANDHDIPNPSAESIFSNVIIYEDTGSNQAPTANDDSISTDQDQAVTINVLSNDTDSDGTLDITTVAITTQGGKGTALAHTNGTVSYTPNTGESGTDTFTYTVDDNNGATSNVATVTITIIEDPGQPSHILIEDYVALNDAFQLTEIPNNASGITWHEALQQYLVVRNNAATIFRYDVNFNYLGDIRISSINTDTEGLSYVSNNHVMVVNEANYAHKLVIDAFTSNINGSFTQTQAYRLLPPAASNKGLEGVAVRKAADGMPVRVYAAQEGTGSSSSSPSSDMRIVYFDMPDPDPFVLLSYDDNLTVEEPFNAHQLFIGDIGDIAGMVYDERTENLIIVSERSDKALQIHPETGNIISELILSGAPQFEGVTIGPNGELVFVSEGNWIRIYTLANNNNQYTLSTQITGNGNVSSNPAGIDCGATCNHTFEENTVVTLSATPDEGYSFVEWGGGECSGTGTCSITMSDDKTVTALFEQNSSSTHELNVNVIGNGTVVSTPNGIDCGTDCHETFSTNTSVTLTASPDQGYILESWQGDCNGNVNCHLNMNNDKNVTATFIEDNNQGGDLSISDMGMHEVSHGDTFEYQPIISGDVVVCRKDIGHDDVFVDSETGKITWDTSGLNFGRGFHIRIKCSNYNDIAYASMVVHVDKTGSSRLRVAGQDGVSEYIGIAGRAMTSGDTIVFPDGEYPVSVTQDESFENAFKRNAPTDGTADQFSTLISQSPGGVVINGAPHDGIGKQKNAFQLTETNYVALVGFVVKNVQRESLSTLGAGNYLLIDFVGAQGAGTNLRTCANFSEASSGECSNAGMRVNGGNPLFQNSYDWGHNRYGIMTRNTHGSITRRSFVRLDEHKGDQPYGGFSDYCDTLHLSQDNTVFDSLAIAAPHYKNYAGLSAYPATGCENQSATLKTEGLLSVNNKLSLSLMDSKAGPNHIWDHIVSYDSEGTCTPQTNRCGNWLLQADKTADVTNSYFGKARGFEGGTSTSVPFDTVDVNLSSEVILEDIPGYFDQGTAPEYLPESLLYYRGRSDTFHGDVGYDQLTDVRRWPIPGEDIIAANMRSYYNENALKVGGGTITIDGNRGAALNGESMSEYFWSYTNNKMPPLVVRVKNKDTFTRIAWEHLSGSHRNSVTGWKVICVSDNNTVLAELPENQLLYNDDSGTCTQYAVKAVYLDGESGIAYIESDTQTLTSACSQTINPGDSFTDAFNAMQSGDTLCLNDGTYHQAMDIPSDMHVRAVNDGKAEIDGQSTLGFEWSGGLVQMKGSNSSVRGLKVHHAGELSDACHISGTNNVVQNMSCSHGGTYKHKIPLRVTGSGHLIENSWAYGEGRYVILCYMGENITFRGNVARWDLTIPNEPTEPNAAFSIYNCSNITIENNISLDYGIPETRMMHGGDFYSPQNAFAYPTGNQNNHWLGNMAINHAVNTDNRLGLRYDASTETFDNVVKDFYVRGSNMGLYVNDRVTDIEIGACTFIDVQNNGSAPGQSEILCEDNADISHRYVNRVKTNEALFPWPNEERIKKDMCAGTERQSEWCLSNKSLTDYVLNP